LSGHRQIRLDDDVAAAVEQRRRQRSIGLSEAVSELIRAGLTERRPRRRFRQRSEPIGLRIDVTDVAEALELLEGPDAR
jgi:Arc/MetJ family transcription regulator